MELPDEGGVLGPRTKYVLIGLVTILPVIFFLFIVFVTFFMPAFRIMTGVVDKGYHQIRPLHRLQIVLLESVMPPNDFLIHGDESELRSWNRQKKRVAAGFAAVIETSGTSEVQQLFIELLDSWNESAREGDRLFLGREDGLAGLDTAAAMERFDARVFAIADRVDRVISKLEDETFAEYQLVGKRMFQGLLFSVLALVAGLAIGMAGSIWLTRARRRIINLTLVDDLTGIYSRRGLERVISGLIERRPRDRSMGYAILMMDIDRFKRINDRHGHDVGDAALKRMADVTGDLIRRRDIFGRFGGEEFLVFLPEASLEEAAVLAERIREGVCSTLILVPGSELSLQMTVSIGCSSGTMGDDSVDRVIKAADTALYQAKQAGRNRVVCSR